MLTTTVVCRDRSSLTYLTSPELATKWSVKTSVLAWRKVHRQAEFDLVLTRGMAGTVLVSSACKEKSNAGISNAFCFCS